jgi:(p)ppGpp synthase/HD superfamily hydrolase
MPSAMSCSSRSSLYSPLVEAAVRLAAQGHHHQLRKRSPGGKEAVAAGVPLPADCVPYVTHLIGTALVLARLGERDAVIASGLLHDYLEDVPDPDGRERIRRAVGEEVLELVQALTESAKEDPDAAGTWPARKREQLERLSQMPRDAVLVKAADLLHNLSSLLQDLRSAVTGEAVWARFNAGPARQMWYYRSVLRAARERLAPNPILAEIESALEAIEPFLPGD